ncbi:MAG TPA: DotU family type IV/VI secretion system protein [Sandaracinaceae bacterium LLY-WYZ-13_1]|nr:DotU family type IV/VI secretion system protein [Sandaracinaceae bacterium LLY-WYZ-13_1]
MDRVTEVTKEVFNALSQIRRADERSQPMPEMLYQRMRSFVDRAMRRASELGFAQQDVQDIGYALVALTDEVVMSKGGELRDYWLPRSLQLQLFNTNVAGEGFFNNLQNLRHDPSRMEVLKVYYLCLLFGFQGQYRVRGGEIELASIVEEIGNTLTRAGMIGETTLAPHAARPQENLGGTRSHMPLILISVAAVVVSLGIYFGLQWSVSSQADDLVEHIQQTNQATAAQ